MPHKKRSKNRKRREATTKFVEVRGGNPTGQGKKRKVGISKVTPPSRPRRKRRKKKGR